MEVRRRRIPTTALPTIIPIIIPIIIVEQQDQMRDGRIWIWKSRKSISIILPANDEEGPFKTDLDIEASCFGTVGREPNSCGERGWQVTVSKTVKYIKIVTLVCLT